MSLRLVVAGNNLAAMYVLDLALEAMDRADVLVIAPPGGVHHSWQLSLGNHAEEQCVRTLMPPDVNAPDVLAEIAAFRPHALLSVYYTQIFREGLLEAVDGPCLNFHPSLLPLHRGTAPLVRCIAEGDTVTGLTVHHIDRGIDTGRIIVQRPMPIHARDTGYQLHQKMARLVRSTAMDLLRSLLAGERIPLGRLQTGHSSYHSSRDPSINHIDWSADGERIRNVVRALAAPLPGAFGLLDGEPLVLDRVERYHLGDRSRPRPAGMIELVGPDRVPLVWCGDGPLRILSFRHDGVTLDGAELASSRRLAEGVILT